jgi:hypothetical protein
VRLGSLATHLSSLATHAIVSSEHCSCVFRKCCDTCGRYFRALVVFVALCGVWGICNMSVGFCVFSAYVKKEKIEVSRMITLVNLL